MGLVAFLKRLFGGGPPPEPDAYVDPHRVRPRDEKPAAAPARPTTGWQTPAAADPPRKGWEGPPRKHPLPDLKYESSLVPADPAREEASGDAPYAFARFGPGYGTYLDLSRDADAGWLDEFDLPHLRTPQDLADWLDLPLGKLAWLTGRFFEKSVPPSVAKANYVYRWVGKKTSGYRLIEEPKPLLKAAQETVLRGILDNVPPHHAAHGFRAGRSIVSNAGVHTGAAVLLKHDLRNFYPSVGLSRVVAIFRTVGFSREVAIWLARLCTSRVPRDLGRADGHALVGEDFSRYSAAHLPQGAPTSPALANLSAYSLDVRLSGLASAFGAAYTRYADDLTFSGDAPFIPKLRRFIPLTERIIRDERFTVHSEKRRVIRAHQRMTVTGVVVNERTNVAREEYDRLKAILHNCLKSGPAGQNRDGVPDFRAHLRGRIAFVNQCNPARGRKLLEAFGRINW